MIRTLAAAGLGLILVTVPAHADTPLIVIDRWWGVDYAREVCKIPASKPPGMSEEACNQERTESYNAFERELKTQFAALPECAEISVSSFGYQDPQSPPPQDIKSRPYWGLSISYFGDDPAQFWQILPPKASNQPMMQGKATPSQIAMQVCNIIKGKGGAVVR